MTTPVEQMFLYGEVDLEYPAPSGILALLGYADLTAGGAIVLALLILIGLIVNHSTALAPWISLAGVQHVVSRVKALAFGAHSLVMQLAAARSVGELQATLRLNLHRVLYAVVARLLGCLAPLKWCCPPNRPLATTAARLSTSFVVCTAAYFGFLLPVSRYLSGVSAGLTSAILEQSEYCPDVLRGLEVIARSSRSQWLKACYCLGEEAGLEIRAIIEDDWQLPHLVDRMADGEIYHLHAIAFAVTCVLLVILAAWSSDVLSWAASIRERVLGSRADDAATMARPRETPLTQREFRLRNMINQYENDLHSLKGDLNAKTEELKVTKRTQDDGWARAKELSARRSDVETSQHREAEENFQLRARLGRLTGQLSMVQGKQANATARARTLSDKVVMLEHQLAQREERADNSLSETHSLRAELDARNEQLVAIEHRLAAAEAREDEARGHHQHLAAEHRQLTIHHKEVAADNHRLTTEHAELRAQYDDLFFMSEPVAEVKTLEQERDCANMQLSGLQDEHAAMKQTAEFYYQETQESLAQAGRREVALQQSLSDLKGAYDMSLAQERLAAQGIRQQASGLAAEVADLQGKVGLAMNDAKRGREETESLKRTIAILEHRLSKHTLPSSGGEIPKRQTGDLGSISTALSESRVTISKQQMEINKLRRHIEQQAKEQAKAGVARPAEETPREEITKLRRALDTEKRARTDDQLRWDKRTRELEAENQRLTISRSNAAAGRGGGMRKSSRP
ncbi:hypothetical protein PHISP_00571 [Aspergillus sp. HF37]|nr:hypothetical protein PHISP_00571 [Aspergillus sp. HF37]